MTRKHIFTDQSAEARAARAHMAEVDADIEGMAKDQRISALTDQWIAEGISADEYTRRLKAELGIPEAPDIAAE